MAVTDHEGEIRIIYSLCCLALKAATTAVTAAVQKSTKLILLQAKRPSWHWSSLTSLKLLGDGEAASSFRLLEHFRILTPQDQPLS